MGHLGRDTSDIRVLPGISARQSILALGPIWSYHADMPGNTRVAM